MKSIRKKFGVPYSKTLRKFRKINLFLPKGKGNGRGLLFIHGGGWKTGSPEMWHYTAEHMARLGYVCGCCSYRLSPKHKFPKQIEDVRLAMAWFRSNAKKLGFHENKIGAIGSSAGGHLVSMLAVLRSNNKLGATPELKDADTMPNAIVCDCPVTDLTRYNLPRSIKNRKDFIGGTLSQKRKVYRLASPIFHVKGGEPPFLFVHGIMDKVVPITQSYSMARVLRAKRVPTKVIAVPKLDHGFAFHKNYGKHLKTYRQTAAFLKKYL